MDKYEDLEQIYGYLDGIRSTIDGLELDLTKKEDLDILLDLRRGMDDLILKTVAYQSFQEGCRQKLNYMEPAVPAADEKKSVSAMPQIIRTVQNPGNQSLSSVPCPVQPVVQPTVPSAAQPTVQPVKKEVFSENSVGKYLIGVLASLLILVGVAVMAASIWTYIPDVMKFTFVLLLGLFMSGLGFLLSNKSETANAFHLSLMGCGTGIIYCSLLAAKMAWSLFPDSVILLLLIIWMISGFTLSKKLHSDLMFSIIQIGNCVSILLIVQLMTIRFSLWLILLFVLCTVVLTTIYANQGFHKANCLAASYIAVISYLMICFRLGILLRRYQTAGDYSTIVSYSLLYLGLFIFSAFLFGLIPHWIRGFSKAAAKGLIASQLLILAVGVVFIMDRISQLHVLSEMISNPAPRILYLLILLAAFIKKNTRTFSFMVLSVNLTFILMDLSSFFLNSWGILPSVLCLAVLLCGLHFKDIWLKIGAIIIYTIITCGILMYSFANLFTNAFHSNAAICFIHSLMILIPGLVIADIVKHKDRALKRRMLALICLDCAVFYVFFMFMNLHLWLMWSTAFAAVAFTVFSRLPVLKEDRACQLHNLFGHGIIQIFLWTALSAPRSSWEIAIGCLIMLLFTAKIVCEALDRMKQSGSHLMPLLCCILMTFNAVDVLHQTPLGDYGILTSLTCLLTAGFCIVLGFRCRVKPLRSYGLLLVIFSVLKMVTFDISSTDSIIRVAAFIGGGLLCFGISWAYNRADKDK